MKIELKKLNALQHAVLPFSEVIDLKDEKMYGRNPFQSPSMWKARYRMRAACYA